MATTYVVLREWPADREGEKIVYIVVADAVAANADQARRLAAEGLEEADLDTGVTLVAVPARNWKAGRGALKAETQRRIRPA